MIAGQPSRTALAAATHRAVHQLVEGGRIFADPLAVRILGADPAVLAADASATPERRPMRIFIAARTRFAEDSLARAVASGTGQLVVLGAGLDSFAYRSPYGDRLRVFEIDHPATQGWKRQRLADAGIAVPPWLTCAPIDFETGTLEEALLQARFDPGRGSFFMWLGVVPYLTEAAIFGTLGYVASLPGGAEIVFDYGDPPETLAPEIRVIHDARAAQVAALGEAWLTYFDPTLLSARLKGFGFRHTEDLGPSELRARYYPNATTSPQRGSHVIRASTKEAP